MAQIFPRVRTASSESQQLINESLKDAICFLHVEYQLEDTISHQRFNVESKDYFGSAEGLCIKTERGWIAPDDIAAPRKSNPDVKKFPGYAPYISSASFLSPSDTVWNQIALPNRYIGESIEGTSYSLVNDTVSFPSHLSLGGASKPSNGWIAWVLKKGNSISLRYQNHRITESDSTNVLRPLVSENIIGGFYVVPRYPSPGEIRFELDGLIVFKDSEWRLIMLGTSLLNLVPAEDKPRLVPAEQSEQSNDKGKKKSSKKQKK